MKTLIKIKMVIIIIIFYAIFIDIFIIIHFYIVKPSKDTTKILILLLMFSNFQYANLFIFNIINIIIIII